MPYHYTPRRLTDVTLNGARGLFKRQKILRGRKSFFFCKDQNSNEAYFQGSVEYLSHILFIPK